MLILADPVFILDDLMLILAHFILIFGHLILILSDNGIMVINIVSNPFFLDLLVDL